MRMSSLWTVKLVLKVEKGFPREFGAKRCGGEGEDGGAEVEGQEGARRLVRCGLALEQPLKEPSERDCLNVKCPGTRITRRRWQEPKRRTGFKHPRLAFSSFGGYQSKMKTMHHLVIVINIIIMKI